MNRLLVGYDGSEPAGEAARVAGRLAQRLGAGVTVLTVGHTVTAVGSGVVPAVDETAFLPVAEEGAELARVPGVSVDVRVALGDAAHMLIEVAAREGHDLIVVGHRGLGGIEGLLLGSVAKRVATDAPCPALVVRGAAPRAIRTVLAAVDGSEHAQRALEAATALAKAFAARTTLLYVLDTQALLVAKQGLAMRRLRSSLQQAGQEALAKAGETCRRAGVDCDVVQVEGRPAEVICGLAQDGGYDLVAVGRRGLGGLARLVLGSVSDAVLAKAGPLVLLANAHSRGPSQDV